MIKAQIIADSKNQFGNRLTTFVLTFPRIILAEFNTHRMFSRNSASSRAIPFEKMVKAVEENPFVPMAWQKDHKGMQGTEYFNEEQSKLLEFVWLKSRDNAVQSAKDLAYGIGIKNELGEIIRNTEVTKQLCNRLLEPFMWHTVIMTTSEEGLNNFFDLRCPQYELNEPEEHIYKVKFKSKKDAIKAIAQNTNGFDLAYYSSLKELDWLKLNTGQSEIHMMALAEAMWDQYNESTPKELKEGQWHIPFGDDIVFDGNTINLMDNKLSSQFKYLVDQSRIKISTARCYTVVGEEGKQHDYKKDIELHDKLLASKHLSPFEHCARAMSAKEMIAYSITHPKQIGQDIENVGFPAYVSSENGWCKNFKGFIQYRAMIEK